jgi:predicted nuclease of predicted toxin-antitoxin system
VNSHLLSTRPAKLVLVSTGNISNQELEQLVLPLIPSLLSQLQTYVFLEIGAGGLIVRG